MSIGGGTAWRGGEEPGFLPPFLIIHTTPLPPLPPTHPPTEERGKAEEGLWFDAMTAVYQPDNQNIFFSGIIPGNTIHTSQGDLKMDEAFPTGRFTPDQQGDAVITGTNAAGQQVKAVVRLALPVYNSEKQVLGIKAKPVNKGEASLLAGGKVEEALADPAVVTLDQDKEGKLTDVKVWVDSTSAKSPNPDPMPATSNGGRRLAHYYYDPWGSPAGAIVGGAVGNAICHGSVVCTAAGAHYGYHHG
jgi:hypothetical protein